MNIRVVKKTLKYAAIILLSLIILIVGGAFVVGYFYSDKIVLGISGARPANKKRDFMFYTVVENLSIASGIPQPKLFVIEDSAPNAFATGRNPEHAVVAVTEGLLELMNREEIEGVLAHELAHIKNRDILIGSIAATLAGAIMVIASMARWSAIFGGSRSDDDEGGGVIGLIVMSIVAPFAAMLIQMAISRSREYIADETGAGFAGNPKGLSGALAKLGAYSGRLPMDANPSTAHMFIVNPLSGRSLMSLFSTHPPLEERISRLGGNRIETKNDDSGIKRGEQEAKSFWDGLSR